MKFRFNLRLAKNVLHHRQLTSNLWLNLSMVNSSVASTSVDATGPGQLHQPRLNH